MVGPDESSASMDDLTGRVLCGKWRVTRRIGQGGMSVVYEAAHRNGRAVAVKALRRVHAANPGLVARFVREGYLANKVDHPDAVSILDDDVEGGVPFLVLELLRGETLAARVAQRGARGDAGDPAGMSLRECLRVMTRVLDVLAAAHRCGIVHRDVKPANVFLTASGGVKLLDFGIARLEEPEGGPTNTASGVALGTPGYMAPEQARGRWRDVDARTDVWACGALLFHLLTGRPVHGGDTPQELLIAAATQPAPPVRGYAPDLPPGIAEVVDVALALEPSRRWKDAAAMRDALAASSAAMPPEWLDRAFSGASLGSHQEGLATSPETPVGDAAPARRRWAPWVGVAALVGAAAIWPWNWSDVSGRAPEAHAAAVREAPGGTAVAPAVPVAPSVTLVVAPLQSAAPPPDPRARSAPSVLNSRIARGRPANAPLASSSGAPGKAPATVLRDVLDVRE